MYVSDYGYAAKISYWSYPLYYRTTDYNDDCHGCTRDYRAAASSNWLHAALGEWTITSSDSAVSVEVIVSSIIFSGSYADDESEVRPVFFLKTSVEYLSGDGTQNSPIRLKT